jgi:fucose permease
MTDNARPPLFQDILEDLRLSDTLGGLMFAATSGGVVIGSLGFARIARRSSALRALQASLLLAAVGAGLTGLATNLGILVGAAAVFGVAFGGIGLSHNLMVDQGSPPRLRRRLLSGLHAFYALASLLAPLAVIGLERAGFGWRGTLALFAVPLAALAVGTVPAPTLPPPPEPEGGGGLRGHRLRVGAVALMVACCVVAELLISTRLPLLLERGGVAPDQAKLGLSGFFACLLASRVGFGLVPLRLSNPAVLALSGGGSLALFASGLLVNPWLLPLVGFSVGPFFPVAVDLLSDEVPGQLDRALGAVFAGISVLLVGAHVGVGALSDAVGLRQAMAVGPISLGVSLIVLTWLSRTGRRGSR